MSKKATEFQKKEMRRMYRGKQIFLRTSCFSITAIFPKKQPYIQAGSIRPYSATKE